MPYGYNTPILMYDGTIKPVDEIEIDDVIMGEDLCPKTVVSIFTGKDHLYKVKYDNNKEYIVTGDHNICLKEFFMEYTRNLPLREYSLLSILQQDFLFGYTTSIEFRNVYNLDIDPHTFGEIMRTENYTFIPLEYKYNTWRNRLDFLSGMVDKRIYSFVTDEFTITTETIPSQEWLDDITYIINSLGFTILQIHKNTIIFTNDYTKNLYKINTEYIGMGDYYGFVLDEPNSKIILGNFIVCT